MSESYSLLNQHTCPHAGEQPNAALFGLLLQPAHNLFHVLLAPSHTQSVHRSGPLPTAAFWPRHDAHSGQ